MRGSRTRRTRPPPPPGGVTAGGSGGAPRPARSAAAGVGDRVRFVSGSSPGALGELAADGTKWSLFFVDGDHEGIAPVRDVRACLPHATWDCAFVLHDLSSPDVAAA